MHDEDEDQDADKNDWPAKKLTSTTKSPYVQSTNDGVQASINVFSRVIAVMILMCLPGIAGYYLDQWLGTNFLIAIGFVLGMAFAVFGFLLVAKQANRELQETSGQPPSNEVSNHRGP